MEPVSMETAVLESLGTFPHALLHHSLMKTSSLLDDEDLFIVR